MGNAKWTGDLLWDALNLNWGEFSKRHPDILRNTYKGKRAYWKAKVMTGEAIMPPEPRLKNEWEVSAFNRDTNEWETTMNHSYEYPVAEDVATLPDDAFIRQGPPIRLNRTRVKPVARESEILAFIPDEQIGYRDIDNELRPIHDEPAMKAARMFLRDLLPDYLYANGDTIDNPTFSKYLKDSNHFTPRTVQAAIDRATEWNAELTEATPTAKKRVRMAGNHDRMGKYILANAEQLYGLRKGSLKSESEKDKPVLSTAFLTRAEELGWDYVSKYPGAYSHSPELIIVHGDRVRSSGSTADLMSKTYPGRNVVFGHVHRRELHTSTFWNGKDYTAVSFGTLARIDGYVPSYGNSVDEVTNEPTERYENWQQGIGVGELHPDGSIDFTFVGIRNGVLRYRGKEYNGND